MIQIGKHRQRQRDFDAMMGAGTIIPIIMIGLVIYFVSVHLIQAVIFTIIFLAILSAMIGTWCLPVRRISVELLKRVFGLRVMEMKLTALAKFLKIEYKHVPEQYLCEKLPR